MDNIKNQILELIEKIKKSNKLIIVEGKNDKKALNQLGLKNILVLSKPLFEIIEEIKDQEIIILTDLDSEGKKIYQELRHHLQKRGKKIDNKLRKLLFKTNISQIEGLAKYLNHD